MENETRPKNVLTKLYYDFVKPPPTGKNNGTSKPEKDYSIHLIVFIAVLAYSAVIFSLL